MVCADTSFLISLYGTDVNTPAAKQHVGGVTDRLVVHAISDFEFSNAVRSLVFRGKIRPPQGAAWQANYEADKAAGILLAAEIDVNAVFRLADFLSSAWTETGGHRGYDILQVAAAKLLGATEFWSFDGKQRALAAAEGLKVGP
jgi:hypothetical protein